jgi:hypothetical protein
MQFLSPLESSMDRSVTVCLGFLLVGIIVGCGKSPPTPSQTEPVGQTAAPPDSSKSLPAADSAKPATKPPADTAKPATKPPDFSISVESYCDDFQDMRLNQFTKKYANKELELTGKVLSFTRLQEPERRWSILLVGAEPKPGQYAGCYTTDKEPWTKCTLNQTVKIRGKAPSGGRLVTVGPSVDVSQITVVDGPMAISVTASDVLVEFARDRKAAVTKYDMGGIPRPFQGKPVLLSGQFVSIEPDGPHGKLMLKTADDRPFTCRTLDTDAFTNVKPGDQITLLGKLDFREHVLVLDHALLTRVQSPRSR